MTTQLTFDEYQIRARETAIYPSGHAVVYPALGLTGETGEICEKIKKAIRDHDGQIDNEALAKEIGDVLWYVAALMGDLGMVWFPGVSITEYQRAQNFISFTVYPSSVRYQPEIWALGLAHVAGEIAAISAIHATNRNSAHRNGIALSIEKITDTLCGLAHSLDLSLEDIARTNLAKLAGRAARDKLHGEGDER
jgi:NTP pyrophosphatase (non-canonical NTP hydrolase)